MSGDAGIDLLYGGDGLGSAVDDSLFGGDGNHSPDGGEDADRADGEAGNGVLDGFSGADALRGDAGNDLLYGGSGADKLFGGTGRDLLTGGSGADGFVFASLAERGAGSMADTITDFSTASGDLIDLRGMGLTYIGTAGFTGGASSALQHHCRRTHHRDRRRG